MRNVLKTLLVVFVIVSLVGFAIISLMGSPGGLIAGKAPKELKLSVFYDNISNISSITFQQDIAKGALKNGDTFEARLPEPSSQAYADVVKTIQSHKEITFEIGKPPVGPSILALLSAIAFPIIILALIYFLVVRPAQQSLRIGAQRFADSPRAAPEYGNLKKELLEISDALRRVADRL